MNNSSCQTKINEDIYVAQVMMNRKVCRFVTQAINHYWESHYTDDEVEWDDLKYIFEQIKNYGRTTLRYETCPSCAKDSVVYGDDWGCDYCDYWYDSLEVVRLWWNSLPHIQKHNIVDYKRTDYVWETLNNVDHQLIKQRYDSSHTTVTDEKEGN